MTTIKDIKVILESLENKEYIEEETECPFKEIIEKHADLPEEKVKEIIEDVKAALQEKSESENEVDVEDAPEVDKPEKTDALKAMNELCGSESEDSEEEEDEVEEQVVSEDSEEEIDDDLIISEDDNDKEEIKELTEEDDDDEDLLSEDADELDSVESDEDFEEEYLEECDDAKAKEAMHEANTAAKAAIANEFDGKGTFSSDIDALTDYLKDY